MLTSATMVVVATSATFAVATTITTSVATTSTTTTAFARHQLDEVGNFSVSSFARGNHATLEVEFLTSERVVKVDDYNFVLHFQYKTLETIAVGIYEGNYSAFENYILLEATVEHKCRLREFDDVLLFVRSVSFVNAKSEVELIASVKIFEFCFKRLERNTEFSDKLEGMLYGSLFYEFVNPFRIVCIKAICHSNVFVHSSKNISC
jgi:hypothetical protein